MYFASDFREVARDALRGNWRKAALASLIAILLGFTGTSSFETDANIPLVLATLISAMAVVHFIIGGAGRLGLCEYYLRLVDGKPTDCRVLFSHFDRLGNGILMKLLMGIYVFLWSLLFVVPGIIKTFSSAMTPYILAENPGMSVNDAITESREMMDGSKWRLCRLIMSFLPWIALSVLPLFLLSPLTALGALGKVLWFVSGLSVLFVANLFLQAYQEAAYAAFYRDLTNDE